MTNFDNDNFANRSILTGNTVTVTGSNIGATGETGEPDHAGDSTPLNSVWWSWTATTNSTVIVNTLGSDFDTTLGIYTGSSVSSLTTIASNDDNEQGIGGSSEVTFSAISGTTYQIAVDGWGSDTGNINLALNIAVAPINDNFANRSILTGNTVTATGSNIGATGETGEPDHADALTPLNSVWWSWTATTNGTVIVNTLGSDFDTTLGVYTGSSVSSLTTIASNDDNEQGIDNSSEVTFSAISGTTYQIAVDGWDRNTGNINLDLDFTPIVDNPYTAIESSGNTKLVKDAANQYFTQVGTNNAIAIKNGEQQIYQDIYTGWQTLAAETVNGDNQVLWKNVAGNYLHIWHLDNNWNWVSSEGQYALNSDEASTQETNFGIDTNGDGVIGNPYTAVESSGNTKLVKDAANQYFSQIGTNNAIAIKNGEQQIYQDIYTGWQTLAAETVNGDNQVLWKNVAGNYLHIWHLDNNWNWVSSEGQYALNSDEASTQETNFGIDTNGDGVIGSLTLAGTISNNSLLGAANNDVIIEATGLTGTLNVNHFVII